jgi:hypothetical protein
MRAAQLDVKRRLVMPPELRPGDAVTIQQVDENSWLVRRSPPPEKVKLVVLPIIERLPDEPEWDKTEAAFVRAACEHLTEPEP